MEDFHRPRTDAGYRQERHQTRWNFLAKLVVEGQSTGPSELFELLGDGLAHARYPRRMTFEVGLRHLDGRMSDRVGCLVVGHGLENELALDLEHVSDLVEDSRQLAVREELRVAGGPLVAGLFLRHGRMVARPHSSPAATRLSSPPPPFRGRQVGTTLSRPARFAA